MAASSAGTVALLVNVNSKKARRNPRMLEELERILGERGPFIQSRSPSELPAGMADVRRANPSILFVCGGDGTLRQTLTHLQAAYSEETLPRIAILRGGTMNTVATSLGIYRSPAEQLRALLSQLDAGLPLATVRRHLLSVNRHAGFIFAIGGFSRFIETYSHGDPTPWDAFKLLTRTVLSAAVNGPLFGSFFQPFSVHLWRDDQPWLTGTTVTNIAASAVRHIGFHFKPFYGAEGEDGSFGLLVFRKPPRRLLWHLPEFFRGSLISDADILQLPAHSVLLKVDEPMRPMLDGDILPAAKEFQIENGALLELVVG